jgi:activator of 2-hydroxyglutaryl-CoA dehydratase
MITAGVDVGAKYAKVVILKDGQVIARAKALVGFDLLKSATEVFEVALKNAAISRSDIQRVVSTGMGRNAVIQKAPINADERGQRKRRSSAFIGGFSSMRETACLKSSLF